MRKSQIVFLILRSLPCVILVLMLLRIVVLDSRIQSNIGLHQKDVVVSGEFGELRNMAEISYGSAAVESNILISGFREYEFATLYFNRRDVCVSGSVRISKMNIPAIIGAALFSFFCIEVADWLAIKKRGFSILRKMK